MEKIIEAIKEEPTFYMLKKVWLYGEENRYLFVVVMILNTIAFALYALEPLVLAVLLNNIQLNGVTSENIVTLILIVVLIPVIKTTYQIARGFANVKKNILRIHVGRNFKRSITDKIFARPIKWLDDRDSGDIIDKTNKAEMALVRFTNSLTEIVRIVVGFGTAIIAIAFLTSSALVLVIVTMILVTFVLYKFDGRIIPEIKLINEKANKYQAGYFDGVSNITSIKILDISNIVSNRLQKLYERFFPNSMYVERTEAYKWFTADLLFTLGITFSVVVIYLVEILNTNELVEVGTLSALLMYLSRIDSSFFYFSDIYSLFRRLKANFENASELENREKDQSPRVQFSINDRLQVERMNFTYEDTPALKNLSLYIEKKQRIAMIGHSGSGKTTLLKVLHGMYEDAQAQIVIDGKAVDKQFHEIDLSTTLVPQDPELFSATITENITFGLDYTDEQIRTATDLAAFTEIAESLPNGFDSKVNEKGVNLSGGQKQRLALARALLFAADKDIILLDESTSSVDPETENTIYKNLFKAYPNKSFIASIHKLNLLKHFDRVVIFDQGNIVADGSFKELQNTSPEFKKLWGEFIATQ